MIVSCTVSAQSTDEEVNEASLDRIAGYQAMARVNTQPYNSDLGAFKINCYVTGDIADYRQIHPDRVGSGKQVAPGTMIVREVLDAAGTVQKLTLMRKGPAGYDPTLGDWWFGVTDPDGVPLVDKGVAQIGRLAQCHNCHVDRARDDFLFGVTSAAL